MSTIDFIKVQLEKQRDDYILLYRDGMNAKKARCIVPSRGSTDSKRGKITTFSTDAARRLREWFFLRDVPDSQKAGVCLTIPFRDFSAEQFKELVHIFTTSCRQQLPDVALVYRVELQKRQVPHIHAVVFFRSLTSPDSAKTRVSEIWLRSVFGYASRFGLKFSFDGFIKRGFRWDRLVGDSVGYFRYLTDHASKHKRDQLGYQGKQWGVVNRKLFAPPRRADECLTFDDESHRVRFFRAWQRFNRLPVRALVDGELRVVKYRRSYRTWGTSFCRGGGAAIRRLWENARAPL